MSVGFSLLCTVFGIPFALTCVKSYYKENAILKSVNESEISNMRQEFLNITGEHTATSNGSSIYKWIKKKNGKELREHLATARISTPDEGK